MFTIEGQESTPDNPVMYVASRDKDNGGFAWYKIPLNQVNPRHATREEMLAFLAYITKNDGNASFAALDTFATIDEYNMEHGWFSPEQDRRDYLAIFEIAAGELKKIIDANGAVSEFDRNQECYDELLKIIDTMIDHSDKMADAKREAASS